MEITIFSTKTVSQLVNKTDINKSFKKREGTKPAFLSSYFTINVDATKINKKWKINLSSIISNNLPPLYKVNKIKIDDKYIKANSSNSEQLANLIANYILTWRNPLQIDNKNIETKFRNQYKKQNNEN